MPEICTNTAVILAAGWGSRIQDIAHDKDQVSKPLIPIQGEPIVIKVIKTLQKAGVSNFIVVTGFLKDLVANTITENLPEGVNVKSVFNPNWHDLANGVSLLSAKDHVNGAFILSMSDHVFDVKTAIDLNKEGTGDMAVKLCIDRKLDTIFDMDDATKVVIDDKRIVEIDKALPDYNAVDTGLFLCQPDIFEALASAKEANGDCSLSDGMRILGKDGRFGYFDVADRLWQDVDTPETLVYAEKLLNEKKILFPE